MHNRPQEIPFDLPNFLNASFEPKKFNSREGYVTTVRALDDLPPWVLERIPELEIKEGEESQYVIKEYNKDSTKDVWVPGNFSVFDKFLFDNGNYPKSLDNKKVGDNISVADKADILRARQEHLRRYFDEDGRKFLLDTIYITSANGNDEVALYEIQKKLPAHIFLDDLRNYNVLSLSKEQKHRLVNDAILLKKILKRMLEEDDDKVFGFFLPDFHSNNIAITKEGNLVIFDINHWAFKRNDDFAEENFLDTINNLDELIDTFKNYINYEQK